MDKPLKSILAVDGICEASMSQKQTAAQEEDLRVSLTFHHFSAEILREFAVKIVKPYFAGNINEAVRCLMQKAIEEETMVNQAIRKTP